MKGLVVMAHRDSRDAAALALMASVVLEEVFERINRLREAVLATKPADGRWVEAQIAQTQRVVLDLLEEDSMSVGMGFVAEPGVVDMQERYMLWWQQSEGRTSRLRLNFDRSSIDVYDYVEMEWFQQPRNGRAQVTFGPYVDYSGSGLLHE